MTADPNFNNNPSVPPANASKSGPDNHTVVNTTSSNTGWILGILALAVLGTFGGLLYQSSQTNAELSSVKRQLIQSDRQIADMQGQLVTTKTDAKREVSESVTQLSQQLEKTRKEAIANSQRATYSARQQTGKVMTELTAKNAALSDQLDQLKKDNTDKSTAVDETINGIKGDVGNVKTDVASTKADLDSTKTDLRRAMGDMGVMSGLIATNSTELGELRKLGEKNYIEFTLAKNGAPQKVGDIQMALKKADTKRSRFTFDVVADDKRIEKKDKTVNEPVQFYTASQRLPYEVVVNSVTKDSIKGYLAVPKVRLAAR